MKPVLKLSILFFFAIVMIVHISSAFAEDYRVLALRVDFQLEDPDEDTTTGPGTFDLDDYYTDMEVHDRYDHPWDVPPHNRAYFEHHLQALNNYWSTVSDGKISISSKVLPESPNEAYTMSREFYQYGNGRSEDQTNTKLVDLVREAVKTCKQIEGDRVDFSQYDTIMVIHAGGARETYGNLNDIPSAYLTPDDFETYAASPLFVDDTIIDKALILPEYASNTGRAGLNGLMAQMFGFRLGLPSFSNNEDGLPAAGTWSLMDTGGMSWGYSTIGFLPTHPSALSKIELGIIEPVIVTSDTTVDIAATHIINDLPRAVKIPISPEEYLLIENRYQYAPNDSIPSGITFSDSDSSGVWLSAPHYDAFIPGPGILIWRVNQQIIDDNRRTNSINNDPYRRGFDLLEADGRQDIGALFGFGDSRSEYALGHADDTYKANGISVCSPTTSPDTGSLWGGSSGVTVTVNSEPGEVMNVSIRFAGHIAGFPVHVGQQEYVTADDLDGDGIDEFMVSGGRYSYFISDNGDSLASYMRSYIATNNHPIPFYDIENNQKLFFVKDVSSFVYGRYLNDEIDHLSEVMVDNFSYDIHYDCNYTLYNNSIIMEIGRFTRELSEFNSIFFHSLNNSVPQEMSISDTSHFFGSALAEDQLALLGKADSYALYRGTISDGELTPININADTLLGPILVDLDRDNSYEAIVTADRGLTIYNEDGTSHTSLLTDDPVGEPVAADLDGDGFPEVIQCTEQHVFAFGANGAIEIGFPMSLPPGDTNEVITSGPVIVDLDGDNSLDIACATSNGRLLAFTHEGIQADGFPILLTGEVTSTPCIFKLSSSGDIGLAYLTTDGYFMAHDLGTSISGEEMAPWPMWKGGPTLSGALLNETLKQEPDTDASFEAYCYPNPVTGDTGTFKIVPEGPTDITVTLYTLDGRKVFGSHIDENEVLTGLANELRFPADDLASGLYIARIETKQKSLTYKVGVLK